MKKAPEAMTDIEIEALRERRAKVAVFTPIALLAAAVAGGAFTTFAPSGYWTLAGGVGTLLLSAIFVCSVHHFLEEEDEYEPIEENAELLDEALELIDRSNAARVARDNIVTSGRILRRCHLVELKRAHDAFVKKNKLDRLKGVTSAIE